MSKTLPSWMLNDYIVLRSRFGEKPFTVDEASKVLERPVDSVMTLLSSLRKYGLVIVAVDPSNPRRKIYSLRSIPVTRGDLESILKKAADLIRTRVDYSFILVLLFYKKISDQWKLEFQRTYKELVEQGYASEEAKELARGKYFHQFQIPEEYLWDNIVKHKGELHEYFSKALKKIGELNEELRPIFDNFDFHIFASNRENSEILRQLVELFDSVPLIDTSPDILGDAYEWLLMMFAPTKAKEGEVFTPREVIRLLVEILDPKPGYKILDPAAGSGGMLIISYKYIEEKHGREEADKLYLFGQEANAKTAALAKMNMYIHGIANQKIEVGDSLLYPKFELGEWDIVLANPPWNQDGYNEQVLKKNEKYRLIYKYGYTPSQTADWAWIQLMLAAAKPQGKVGVVIDNGALFRGGREKSIRSKIIEEDLVETVILLPEKLFYNTGAPGAIIIFNKNKPQERRNKILFINASNEYEKHPNIRRLNRLSKQNIEKIAKTYYEYKEIPGFSRIVGLSEIRENNYNLNVTLYVTPPIEIEEIDLEKELQELIEIEKQAKTARDKAIQYIQQIIQANKQR
ncbi:N-6 DNA methylase [Staphylothermus marinus F1]|uniref:site-specific DNA-methyltransferase (adenine-specific) n=1 Tax=Staphylothermus marinus (strain ATCC 43588 / DSM 3639 / JCM 9404 / F1) TaxID=399550 RepID=A3DMK2_STAMF|nr:type I restriction-modification system subunit M [Staphylothermus marinus]ABN69862.1 N-6 DNA methylase [Staphylothermus marinus F1]